MRLATNKFPPIGVLLGQFGGAILGGVLFVPLAYIITSYLFMGAGLGMGLLTVQLFGIIVGFGLGAGLGASLVGRLRNQPGNI